MIEPISFLKTYLPDLVTRRHENDLPEARTSCFPSHFSPFRVESPGKSFSARRRAALVRPSLKPECPRIAAFVAIL